tara:strand:- start:200 stop:700 length:501 start_codon:yes stop_codon:yes gene_type:complete
MTVDQRTEPLEQELLLEETKEGHASQLKRTRASYRKKNCNDQAIFEYAWTLTRSPSSKKSLQGIRVLKALTFQNPEFAGYGYLAIAQAYLRLGNYQKCRQHAHMLMQAYPKADPERNANLKKAIELHKVVRNKTTESSWSSLNATFILGIVTALGVIGLRKYNRAI